MGKRKHKNIWKARFQALVRPGIFERLAAANGTSRIARNFANTVFP
jgi:hypothetical protein